MLPVVVLSLVLSPLVAVNVTEEAQVPPKKELNGSAPLERQPGSEVATVDLTSEVDQKLIERMMKTGRVSKTSAKRLLDRVTRGREEAAARSTGEEGERKKKLMSEEELRTHIAAIGKRAAGEKARGEMAAYAKSKKTLKLMAESLRNQKEKLAFDTGVTDWFSEFVIEPPPGVYAVALRRSPQESDRMPDAQPLRGGTVLQAIMVNKYWLKTRRGAYIPLKFARPVTAAEQRLGGAAPATSAPTETAPPTMAMVAKALPRASIGYGLPAEGVSCRSAALVYNLLKQTEGPGGEGWADVKYPLVQHAPGASMVMRLWTRRCAAMCAATKMGMDQQRCRSFTVYPTAKCDILPIGCTFGTAPEGAVSYQRLTHKELMALPPETASPTRFYAPPVASPAPPEFAAYANAPLPPLDSSSPSSVRLHIWRFEKDKEEAKTRDDLLTAMMLRRKIVELQGLLKEGAVPQAPPAASDVDVNKLVSEALAADDKGGGGRASSGGRKGDFTIYFGAGCFFKVREAFEAAPVAGVKSVVPGWMGGFVEYPTPELVARGITGHAEVVRVEYDDVDGAAGVVFRKLLERFWASHNPSEKGRQGADVGSQFRSALFFTTPSQGSISLVDLKRRQHDAAYNPRRLPIQTEIAAAGAFWPAPFSMSRHCRADSQ
eukprot:Hpha_TRINITY_DN4993_c0_g2::TRINITY_DN4993_c0_g2_i1::g.51318::m.51318